MAASNFHNAKISLPNAVGVGVPVSGRRTLPGMATGDLHLSIHLGARWTAAVATLGGRTWPVAFDGQTRLPSGVWTDPQTGNISVATAGLAAGTAHPDAYLPDPMAALRTAPIEADAAAGAAVPPLLPPRATTPPS